MKQACIKKHISLFYFYTIIFLAFVLTSCSTEQVNNNIDSQNTLEQMNDEEEQLTSSTQSSTADEIATYEMTEGIVMLSTFYDYSTSKTQSGVRLSIVNPKTGIVSPFKEFPYSGEVLKNLNNYPANTKLQYNVGEPYLARQAFDKNYSKLTVSLEKRDDGSNHVGYIENTGNCVDVSELISTSSNSFSEKKVKHTNPRIGADDYYYFTDESDSVEQEKRVPLYNISPESVENIIDDSTEHLPDSTATKRYSSESNKYFVIDDKNEGVLVGYNPNKNGSKSEKKYERIFLDWIDETTFLASDFTVHKAFYEPVSTIEQLGAMSDQWVSTDEYGYLRTEIRQLLPENERTNTNPIVSPDGNIIAFTSRISDSKDKIWTLFTVSVDGGEPVEIAPINSNETSVTFIDWR